jgi:hypothetical protein
MTDLRRAAGKALQLTCVEASSMTGYTSDHISLILRKGKLEGEKRGRDWLVDAGSLYRYVKEKPKPGPKRH